MDETIAKAWPGVILQLAALFVWMPGARSSVPASDAGPRVAVFEGIAPTSGSIEPPVDAIRGELARRGLPAVVLPAGRLMAGEGPRRFLSKPARCKNKWFFS